MKQWRIILGLLGGICIHLVIGTSYIAGNISVYLVSYLRLQGEDVTLEDAVILLPLTFVGITLTLFFGARLSQRFGPRLTTILGNSIVVLATFCGSFCKTFWSFCLVYSLLFGLGDGISYMSPLIMGWSYYPQHKGRISGLILTFFALGTSVFSLVSTAIINPDNKKASIKVKNGATTDHYYSAEIADGFPAMMRWLSLCYLCISVIGVTLLAPINPPSKQDVGHYQIKDDMIRLPSVKDGLKHRKFWLLFFMGLLSSSKGYTGFGMYLAAAYKDFGSDKINDDAFLAAVGSISFFMNGIFRIIFAQLMDYSSFKLVYGVLLAIQVTLTQIVVSVTLDFVASIKGLFLVWVSVAMACEGGHFSLFSAVSAKLFGKEKGGAIFSLVYYCFGIGSVLGFILQLYLVKVRNRQKIGYISMFLILSVTAVVSLVLLLWRFEETSPWKIEKETSLSPINDRSADDSTPDNPSFQDISLHEPGSHSGL